MLRCMRMWIEGCGITSAALQRCLSKQHGTGVGRQGCSGCLESSCKVRGLSDLQQTFCAEALRCHVLVAACILCCATHLSCSTGCPRTSHLADSDEVLQSENVVCDHSQRMHLFPTVPIALDSACLFCMTLSLLLYGHAGEKVRVVAIGGSVTTGMGARNLTEAYPYRIVQWLRSLGSEKRPADVEVGLCITRERFLPHHGAADVHLHRSKCAIED